MLGARHGGDITQRPDSVALDRRLGRKGFQLNVEAFRVFIIEELTDLPAKKRFRLASPVELMSIEVSLRETSLAIAQIRN